MHRFFIALALLLTLLARPSLADSSEESQVIAWLESQNCRLSSGELLDLALTDDGVSPRDVRDAAQGLVDAGRVRRDRENAFVLVSGPLCSGTAVEEMTARPGSPEAVLISLFEAANCFLSQRDAVQKAREAGLSMDDIDAAGEAIGAQGGFLSTEAGLRLVIGAVCGAS